jgi:14-3-3 protein epsilon
MANRNVLVFKAKLAEEAKRYEDMVSFMKSVAETCTVLTDVELKLLTVAYKNVVNTRRHAWHEVTSIELRDREMVTAEFLDVTREYREKIEKEISDICKDILYLVENNLIIHAVNGESRVFYYKMKGDYNRYLAEIATDSEKKEAAEKCFLAYKAAIALSMVELAPTHPVRLSLFFNFSVFYYDILKSAKKACKVAKSALDYANADLHPSTDHNYAVTTKIVQMLEENMSLWTSEMELANQNAEDSSEQSEDQESDFEIIV